MSYKSRNRRIVRGMDVVYNAIEEDHGVSDPFLNKMEAFDQYSRDIRIDKIDSLLRKIKTNLIVVP